MKMTSAILKTGVVTSGAHSGLATPCQQQAFDKTTLDDFFSNSLPRYLKEMGANWETIQCTTVSGLMSVPNGGPIDDCVRDGAWDPELQSAHGGPIPFLSCSKGSRGAVEVWPYAPRAVARRWGDAVAHGIYTPVGESESRVQNSSSTTNLSFSGYQPYLRAKAREDPRGDYSEMDWTIGRASLPMKENGPLSGCLKMVRKGKDAGDLIRRGTEQGRKD